MILAVAAGQGRLYAIAINWDGGAGTANWHDADNWNPNQVPVANDDRATIAGGGTVQAGFSGVERIGKLTVGSGGTEGNLTVTGGTLDINQSQSGASALNVITIGAGAGSVGNLVIDDGAEVAARGANVIFRVGTSSGGTGNVTVGGTFAPYKRFQLIDGTLTFLPTADTLSGFGSAFNDGSMSRIDTGTTLGYVIDGTTNGVLDLRTQSPGGSPLTIDPASNLDITLLGSPGDYSVGQQWTLMRWDNSLTGTFSQGSTFYNGQRYSFAVDYAGGAGSKDVVLELTAMPGPEPGPGTTTLIDFGRDDNPSSAAYNSIDFIGPNASDITTGSVALTDTSGVPTGWSIAVTEDGSGNGGGAGAGADISVVPAAISGFETTAYEDSLFANGTSASMTVSLTGLDDSLNYDLLFYGSRASGQSIPDQTWHLIEGTGAADVVHASGLNSISLVQWNSIRTNGSGEIAFTIKGTSSGALALNFGSISAISVSAAVPEPSTFVLATLGLLGLGWYAPRRKKRAA